MRNRRRDVFAMENSWWISGEIGNAILIKGGGNKIENREGVSDDQVQEIDRTD